MNVRNKNKKEKFEVVNVGGLSLIFRMLMMRLIVIVCFSLLLFRVVIVML